MTSAANQQRLLQVPVANARNVLIRIVRNERRLPQPNEMAELISIDCDLEYKYNPLSVAVLIQNVNGSLSNVRSACVVLRNKFKQLLLPREERSADWSVLKVSYLRSLPEAARLLETIGFVQRDENFIANEDRITTDAVVNFLVDISMIVEELNLYLSGQHQRMDVIKAYLSSSQQQKRDDQKFNNALLEVKINELPDQVAVRGIARKPQVRQVPPLPPPKPTPLRPSSPPPPAALSSAPVDQSPLKRPSEEQVKKASARIDLLCDLCGDEPVALVCNHEACPRRHLCLGCDQRWHGHPGRRSHKRVGADTVTLRREFPAPLVAVATLPRPKTALDPVASGIGPRLIMAPGGKNSVSYVSQLGLATSHQHEEKPQQEMSAKEGKIENMDGESQKSDQQSTEKTFEAKELQSEEQQRRQAERDRLEQEDQQRIQAQQDRLEQEEQQRRQTERDRLKQEEQQRKQAEQDRLEQEQTQTEIDKQMEEQPGQKAMEFTEQTPVSSLQFKAMDIAGDFYNSGCMASADWDTTGFATMPSRRAAPSSLHDSVSSGEASQIFRPPAQCQTLSAEMRGGVQNLEHQRNGLNRISRVEATLDLRQEELLNYMQTLNLRPYPAAQPAAAPSSAGFPTPPISASPPPAAQAVASTFAGLVSEEENESGREDIFHTPRATPPLVGPSQLSTSVAAAPPSDDEMSGPMWTCPNCTVNIQCSELKILANNRAICPVCSMTSDLETYDCVNVDQIVASFDKREPTATSISVWPCPKCTFVNERGDCCQICDNRRSSTEHTEPSAPPADFVDLTNRTARLLDRLRRSNSDNGDEITDARLVAAALAVDPNMSDAQLTAWMRYDWPRRVDRVRVEITRHYLADRPDLMPHTDQLAFSRREVSEAMADCPHLSEIDCQPVVLDQCVRRRERVVLELARLYPKLSARDHHVAAATADGSLELALNHLNGLVLDSYLGQLSECGDGPASGVTFDGTEFSLHTLMAEHGLRSEAVARRLTMLHNKEDFGHHQLEDLVEAVKNTNAMQDDNSWLREVGDYLNKICPICNEQYPRHRFLAMVCCSCELCQECFYGFVTTNIKDMHITHLNCPVCRYPKANEVENLQLHFQHLLGQIAQFQHPTLRFDPSDVLRMQDRLFDWQAMRDPKFVWCSHCGTGFELDNEELMRFTCPHCRGDTCRKCRKPWEKQHKGLSCEDFERWKQENDPEFQTRGVAFYLQQNGIECPACHFKYALAGGGCLHFVCRMCRANFCSGCGGLFNQNGSQGLACQHPRSCLYYLRDFEIKRLQQLLLLHKVEFRSIVPDNEEIEECKVMEQKETTEGLVDEACSRRVSPGRANLCDKHYSEYLVTLINRNRLDPVEIMTQAELLNVCRRHNIVLKGSTEVSEAELRQTILAKCPL